MNASFYSSQLFIKVEHLSLASIDQITSSVLPSGPYLSRLLTSGILKHESSRPMGLTGVLPGLRLLG
ncbi:hypothetical protein Q1695_002822 [Nippostrongylus brasiliensis]|nr:hypothetical protein Q1695_002822 [Nippostrongylus brasiliensis]